jgi:hypothetical protein
MIAANLVIRHPRADERADWEPLWKGYQAFYKVVISDETTSATWARLHDPDEPMGILGAYVDGRLMRDRSLPLSPLVLDRWRLLLPSRPVRRGKRTPSRPRARPDRGGGRTGASGGREPALLAHPREQCECAGTLRQAGGALRVHPISQTFLTRFARPKDDTRGDGADRP